VTKLKRFDPDAINVTRGGPPSKVERVMTGVVDALRSTVGLPTLAQVEQATRARAEAAAAARGERNSTVTQSGIVHRYNSLSGPRSFIVPFSPLDPAVAARTMVPSPGPEKGLVPLTPKLHHQRQVQTALEYRRQALANDPARRSK
jgi:hypothetical protein